ncbi:DUF3833 domain-containing protein [Craterilacuibacter sp. RT1T]|uniref:DUF3833 domain-containing protein n=1 Tax=Craterilacuibacter sp. RT1T TaxID=2942211 RepID=UPI0020BDF2E4|nr:DUF3833 domain-containing protein [Craterilacuibacter sp. RT1T]MCL6262444.1 DUF3833 domain-containing protein [Craterilacuibacter sp. RT1T]
MIRSFTLLLCALLLGACSSPKLADYQATTPALKLEQFFAGPLRGWGMVQDRNGKVLRRFVVDIDASWQGTRGQLDERFVFDDGERQRRVWTLMRQADGRYLGRAGDVVGDARGAGAGAAFHLAYTLRIQVDGREWDVAIDDWMLQIDDKQLLNRSVMRKFGIEVGTITLMLQKGAAP